MSATQAVDFPNELSYKPKSLVGSGRKPIINEFDVRQLTERIVLDNYALPSVLINEGYEISTRELQSTNEEFGTSKEVLQSTNEELVTVNSELQQNAIMALNEAKKSYYNLYNFAPMGFLTLDKQGSVQEANLTLASLLKTEQEELINQSFQRYGLHGLDGSYEDV